MSYPDKNQRILKKDVMKKAEEAVRQFRASNTPYDPTDDDDNGVYSDMLGSYTGMYYDGGEPAQDADDL